MTIKFGLTFAPSFRKHQNRLSRPAAFETSVDFEIVRTRVFGNNPPPLALVHGLESGLLYCCW